MPAFPPDREDDRRLGTAVDNRLLPTPQNHPPWGVPAAEYAAVWVGSRLAVKAERGAQYIQRVPQPRHGSGGSSEACARRKASYSSPLQISEMGRSKALPRMSAP
jgi:hypothetical protein